MEIEKISDNQIRFVLNNNDLKERDIKISELAYGTDKARELFQEMMNEALIKYDFHADTAPLMIEAIPISSDSIIIVVTKVTDPSTIENKLNIFGSKDYIENPRKAVKTKQKQSYRSDFKSDYMLIYSFDDFKSIVNLSKRINNIFVGHSSIYKYKARFYLVLENSLNKKANSNLNFESILAEYGERHLTTFVSKSFLTEHGEQFVKDDAIELLTKFL